MEQWTDPGHQDPWLHHWQGRDNKSLCWQCIGTYIGIQAFLVLLTAAKLQPHGEAVGEGCPPDEEPSKHANQSQEP